MAKKTKKKSKPKAKPRATPLGVKRLTPVLYVREIEPCFDLWVNRLGFRKTIEVPEGARLGFVAFAKGKIEIMYQTLESVGKDVPAFASRAPGQTNLFLEVEDIDAIEAAVNGIPHAVPRRKTFYGSTEVGIQDPAGNTILFAEMGG